MIPDIRSRTTIGVLVLVGLLGVGLSMQGNLAGLILLFDAEATAPDEPIRTSADEVNLDVDQLGKTGG